MSVDDPHLHHDRGVARRRVAVGRAHRDATPSGCSTPRASRSAASSHDGVGAEFDCLTRVGPLHTTDHFVVTKWEPGAVMGIEHRGAVTGVGEFRLRPLAGGDSTDFCWEETLTFPWWLGSVAGEQFGRPVLKRIWEGNLRRLKARVEDAPGSLTDRLAGGCMRLRFATIARRPDRLAPARARSHLRRRHARSSYQCRRSRDRSPPATAGSSCRAPTSISPGSATSRPSTSSRVRRARTPAQRRSPPTASGPSPPIGRPRTRRGSSCTGRSTRRSSTAR